MTDDEAEFHSAIQRVISSKSRKRLVVAGPGTGKTTLFEALLKARTGDPDDRLVLTFINSLRDDLEVQLSKYARVFTLHSYCLGQLYRKSGLRSGLSSDLRCQPGLASMIRSDWNYLHKSQAPHFVPQMRTLEAVNEVAFYLARGNYYDAVDFDDCVFRVCKHIAAGDAALDGYELILIDEYQDFNPLEAKLIDFLSEKSPILIAGDDDQALYTKWRSTSWDFIRSLHRGDEYEKFELPFCLRCPQIVVEAVNDVIGRAKELRRLERRIPKPYRYFAPAKNVDSVKYPTIALVETSVQRLNANYMGKYIADTIRRIPSDECEAAMNSGYPTALIIAAKQYRTQIITHLQSCGDFSLDTKQDAENSLDRTHGLEILKADSNSNLGWRIILEKETNKIADQFVVKTADMDRPLGELLPRDFRNKILAEAAAWKPVVKAEKEDVNKSKTQRTVKITSFEGAKGLSAQHVFIAGLHNHEFPKDPANVQDIEICKFVVGLTRTRKRCYLIYTNWFGQKQMVPSCFISWIADARFEHITVGKGYWTKTPIA